MRCSLLCWLRLVAVSAMTLAVAGCLTPLHDQSPADSAQMVRGPTGKAFVVECRDLPDCASKARTTCAGDYQVVTSGSNTREEDDATLLQSIDRDMRGKGDEDDFKHVRTVQQLMFKCSPRQLVSPDPKKKDAGAAPPQGVAGFDFGASVDEARRACEAAGHTFELTKKGARCDAPAKDVGVSGLHVELDMCDETVCRVRLVRDARPRNKRGWIKRFASLKKRLKRKYGKPHQPDARTLAACRDDFDDCMQGRDASLVYRWVWPQGPQIALAVIASPPDGPRLELQYTTPVSTSKGQDDGL